MPLYDQMTSSSCDHTARVFAAGSDSGGNIVSILGCEYAQVLRAIAPSGTRAVSAYPLDTAQRTCTGQVAAIVIHGLADRIAGPENGPKTRDFYRALNHCGDTTEPAERFSGSPSNCVLYRGCDDGFPLYW